MKLIDIALNMKKVSSIKRITVAMASFVALVTVLSSCGKSDQNSPGVEYMPDMYRSPSHEANLKTTYDGDSIMVNREPVEGTIARGYMPYTYPNTAEGYESAGQELKNPIVLTDEVLTEGEDLYVKYCVHCHGTSGAGDGAVAAKLPGPPPSYTSPALINLPQGKVFHTLTYGKGMMGSHASQLTQEERWKVVHYVQKLQNAGKPAEAAGAVADTAATN